jgi:signal transduction histidine kinase/CheY-like chemotaxis protein
MHLAARFNLDSESDLRISPKPVLAVLVIVSQVLAWGGEMLPYSETVARQAVKLFLVVLALSASSWLLFEIKPAAGRWSTVVTSTIAIFLVSAWLGVPQALALLAVSTALAAVLIGLPGAMAVALAQTLLLGLLLGYPLIPLELSTIVVSTAATWAMLGVMYAAYGPLHQRAAWMQEYYQHTYRIVEESRNRKAELVQALEGMANANRQLALASERATALRTIAEEAQRAKTVFVASVSHEFRTPLNMIVGLVELMVETPEIYAVMLSPKMRRDLETVHRNCERLSKMIDDILNLTRIETGRLALHREHVELKDIIDSSAAVVRPLLEQKGLSLQVALSDDLPQLYCDRTRIEQVLLNLLSNAARFTQEGGITVKATQQDGQICICVSDTGPGISPEDAERVFEPFWQGSDQLWRDKGGSGLGLSISRRFVELHGGRMWLESELGIGTSFFFALPTSPPVGHRTRPGHMIREDWVWREHAFEASRVASTDQLVRSRLVIYDAPGTLYPQLVRYSDEVEFVVAQDADQVVREVLACPAHAVLMNATAPEDLVSVVDTIRRRASDTPIIGCSVPPQVEHATQAGALGYLIKPVSRAELQEALRAVDGPIGRVLLVDDDRDVLRLFSQMLHVCDSALEIVTASSGREALERLRSSPPDLMLLDVVMPDISGWQLLGTIDRDEGIARVPTFFVSAQDPGDEPPISEYLLAAMDGGLSPSKLLRCSLGISELLLQPEEGLDLGPV